MIRGGDSADDHDFAADGAALPRTEEFRAAGKFQPAVELGGRGTIQRADDGPACERAAEGLSLEGGIYVCVARRR